MFGHIDRRSLSLWTMPIDRASPLPLWAQLLALLQERIAAGGYVDGFPTDAELSAEFDVSRHTVRDAVRRLQEQGVLTRRRGVGSFVVVPDVEQPCGAIYSLFRSIEERGREQRSDVLDLSVVSDPAIAARLGMPAQTALVRLERLRRIDGDPLAHDTAWLPAEIARPLLDVDFGRTALYDELARVCGVRPDSGSEWIRPEMPSPRERELLGVAPKVPVYHIDRIASAGGRPIEWRQTLIRADRFVFVATWSPGSRYEPLLTDAEAASLANL